VVAEGSPPTSDANLETPPDIPESWAGAPHLPPLADVGLFADEGLGGSGKKNKKKTISKNCSTWNIFFI
jgi:hypothetical protein